MQLANKPVASHEHIIFSLKEYKVSLREPWLLWATFLFRLSVPIIGKPRIAAALGVLGDQSIVLQLRKLSADGQLDREVQGSIAAALAVLGDHSVVQELLILLADEKVDLEIRGSIAETLGGLGDRLVMPELLTLLENEHVDMEIRASIAAALGILGDQSIVPQLLELLGNKGVNEYVREGVATALGQLAEDKATVDKMTALLQISGITNAFYNALWNASRRVGVKVEE
jgi:hypothetical protein